MQRIDDHNRSPRPSRRAAARCGARRFIALVVTTLALGCVGPVADGRDSRPRARAVPLPAGVFTLYDEAIAFVVPGAPGATLRDVEIDLAPLGGTRLPAELADVTLFELGADGMRIVPHRGEGGRALADLAVGPTYMLVPTWPGRIANTYDLLCAVDRHRERIGTQVPRICQMILCQGSAVDGQTLARQFPDLAAAGIDMGGRDREYGGLPSAGARDLCDRCVEFGSAKPGGLRIPSVGCRKPPASPPACLRTTVFLVRHADRGQGDDLTPLGLARAQELVHVGEFAGIDAIYHTDTVRTRMTAEPLATRLGIAPIVHAESDVTGVVSHVRANQRGKTVFVVGHSNTVPAIIAALGGPTLPNIPGNEFDNLFVLVMLEDGTAKLNRLQYGAASP